jgi:hypothetical protein
MQIPAHTRALKLLLPPFAWTHILSRTTEGFEREKGLPLVEGTPAGQRERAAHMHGFPDGEIYPVSMIDHKLII